MIECKKFSTPVAVEKVEAFATKSRGAKANKAVIVSESGFQSGCLKVARENNLVLLKLSARVDIPPGLKKTGEKVVWCAVDFILHLANGVTHALASDPGRLNYQLKHSSVTSMGGTISSLESIVERNIAGLPITPDENVHERFLALMGMYVTVPHELDHIGVQGIAFVVKPIKVAVLTGPNPSLDDAQLARHFTSYVLEDVISGKEVTIAALGLRLGFDTHLTAGRFYANPSLGNSYYIEDVLDDIAEIVLLESYARGNLIQAFMSQKLAYQDQYVEVTEPVELARLKRLWSDLQRSQERK